jgi:hypothetical protein
MRIVAAWSAAVAARCTRGPQTASSGLTGCGSIERPSISRGGRPQKGAPKGIAVMAHAGDVARWYAEHGLQMPVRCVFRGRTDGLQHPKGCAAPFPERSSDCPSDNVPRTWRPSSSAEAEQAAFSRLKDVTTDVQLRNQYPKAQMLFMRSMAGHSSIRAPTGSLSELSMLSRDLSAE